jgi:hypothetical protein
MKKEQKPLNFGMVGKAMGKLSTQYQMEASMISIIIILLGLIIMAIYMMFLDITGFMKIMIVINAVAGFIFLSSFLATQYQQYQSFIMAQKIQEDIFK